jgi:hypothetical protein
MAQPIPHIEAAAAPIAVEVPLDETLLTAREQNLLDNTHVIDTWMTYEDGQHHVHQTQRIAMPRPGRVHTRLVTERHEAPYRIVGLEGWTESIHTPLAHNTHAHLAHLNPHASVSTEATYGIDGSTRSPRRHGRLDLEEMAEETLDTLVFQYEDEPLVITATSMAAAILARMERLRRIRRAPLNIVHRVLYEPCLTLPERSGVRMIGRFAAHMANDLHRVQRRTPLMEKPRLVTDYIGSRPRRGDITTVIKQGLAVKDGTSWSDIQLLASTKPSKIQGTKDCLKSPEVDGLEGFIAHDIEGAGHAMGAVAVERAVAITGALRARGL